MHAPMKASVLNRTCPRMTHGLVNKVGLRCIAAHVDLKPQADGSSDSVHVNGRQQPEMVPYGLT